MGERSRELRSATVADKDAWKSKEVRAAVEPARDVRASVIEAGVADDTGARRIEVLRPAVRVREGREAPAERAFELALAAPDLLALLRQVYAAVGRPPQTGTDFDKTMEEEQRTVVLVAPERIYVNM